MKLERLEMLNLISTKNIIVNEVLRGLDKKFYYNKYELEINLSLVLFTLLGNTELHKEMDKEDVDWVSFVNDNYSLIEELKTGDYAEVYNDIFTEIQEGSKKLSKYSYSAISVLEEIGNMLTQENIEKFKGIMNQVKE